MKLLYRVVKWPFVGAYAVNWRSPLSDTGKKDWQSIVVKSESGGRIQGLFAKARTSQTKATIVLGHPMGKEAKGYFIKHGYTDLLLDHGFNTLVFDINGFGESSSGSFSYYQDILAIGDAARSITPDLPIGYHGISLGGQWAIIAFCEPSHPYTFAIIESAAATVEEFWINFPTAYKVLRGLNVLLPRYARKIRPVARMPEIKNLNSLLLIYSHTDSYTPVGMGERLKSVSPVPTELWTVTDAPHALLMRSEHKEEYQKKILEYFNQASRQPTGIPGNK